MDALTRLLFGAGVLISLGICAVAVYAFRRWDEPGVVPFAAFVFAFGGGGVAVSGLSLLIGATHDQVPVWTQVGFIFIYVWSLPWALFGLQYTGRYTQIDLRAVALVSVPQIVLLGFVTVGGSGIAPVPRFLSQLFGGISFFYVVSLVGLGVYLLVQTSYRYGHLSPLQGVSLSVVPAVHLIVLNTVNTTLGPEDEPAIAGLLMFGYGVPLLGLSLALFRYDLFDSTPAIGEVGERAMARETNDLLVVVDDDDRIIKLNQSAAETLGVARANILGADLAAVFDRDVTAFREQQTVELETTPGTRSYDTQVSRLTDQHDRTLGHLLTLHDVTERDLREQRLSVLNRVLRHNLRNKVEVVKAHAEMLDGEREHIEAIREATDDIVGLGKSARSIDQVVSEATRSRPVDVDETVAQTVETLAADSSMAVDLDLPDALTVETNPAALRSALESAVENALTYADSRVGVAVEPAPDGCLLTVTDDGPGIPQSELDSVSGGTETALEHGTGLGLWQLRWAVTTMGGDLSFETDDGTTVEIAVPDRRDHE